MKKKQKINREETFKLIIEKKSEIDFDSINEKSDHYWEEVCENLAITPVYEQIIPVEN